MSSGKVKCTCGWSWNKSDSSKKDMYICHECGRDNSNNMKNGGWLDSYADGGTMQEHQENYNDSEVSLPEGFVGMGNNTKGRDYSPAWGGQFQNGGPIKPLQKDYKTKGEYNAALKSYNVNLHKYELANNPERLKGESAKDYETRTKYFNFKIRQQQDKDPITKSYLEMKDDQNAATNPIAKTLRQVFTSPAHVAHGIYNAANPKDLDKYKSRATKNDEDLDLINSSLDAASLLIPFDFGMKADPLWKQAAIRTAKETVEDALFNAGKKVNHFISNFQGGGRVPIYVESKNDPRYKAYQDSLGLYKENSYQQFTENSDPEIKNKLIQSRIPYNSLPELPTVKGKRVGFERKDKTADEKNKKSIIYSEKIKPEYFNLNKFIDFDDAHQLTSYYKKPQQEVKVKPTTTKRTTKPTSGYILQADGSKLYDKSIPAGKFFDPDKYTGDGPWNLQDIPQNRKPVTSVVNNLTLAGLENNPLELGTNLPELRPQVRPVKDWKYIWKHAGTTQFGYVNSPEDMDHWVDWRDWYSTGGGKDKGDSVTITPEYQMGGEVYPVNYVPKAQAGRSTFQPIMPAIDFISDKLSSWFGNDEEEAVVKKPVAKGKARTLKIVDPRKKMMTTNQPLRPNSDLLTGNYSSNHLDKLMQEAKRQGLSKQDMMNLSAMGFQETKWGRSDDNIGHVLSNFKGDDYYQQFINAYKEKMKEADRLGITDPAMRLQVYNGLGTITPKTEKKYHGYEMQKIYGVPIPKGGISMKKNPLYGKQIIDVRDNVLAENPEYVQYLDSIYKAPVPGYMKDVQINKQKVPKVIHDGNSGSFPKTKGFAPRLDKHQMGGSIPGAVGFSYARVGAPSKGPRRNQTDVTDASAQNGKEMKYYQEGLDFKPKSISKNGGWLDSYEDGGVVKDDMGYWNPDNWGKAVEIGSTDITMEGVDQPLLGISDTGDTKLMKPGKNYKFKGKKVTEYPMAQGGKKIKIKDDREQTIKTKESTFVPIIKEIKKPAKVNSQIQKEIKFMKDWTNSPMYNTMLNNSTRGVADEQDIKNIRKERLNDLSIEVSNTPFFFDDDTGGSSQVATGDIKFYPTAYSDSDVFKGTPAHEISHTQDSMRNPFRNLSNTLFGTNFRTSYIPQSDINMMDKYSKSGATYDLLFNKRKDDDEWDGTRDFFKYVTTPTETRARLNSLRYIAKENNIYDPYTQKINMDQLEKLRQRSEKLGKQKGFDPYMQLNTSGGYNDEEILNMLNTISQNKQPNKTPNIAVAKNGLRQEQKGLQNLDNLTNFTNYNKPQPGGWLNKYN